MTNTNNPLSYLGVRAKNPANVIEATRAPTANDTEHLKGSLWIDTTTSNLYTYATEAAGAATWVVIGGATADVATINSLSPVAGDILIDGGTNMTDVNAGNSVTLNLDDAITLATSVTSPIFASAAAMAINPVGALTVTGGAAIDIDAAAGSDITIQMGDNAGANVIDFEDSDSATVASLTSDGALTVVNIDGILGATTPAAISGTSISGKTINVTNTNITSFNVDPILQSNLNTGAAPTGATGDYNIMYCQDGVTMKQFILGAGQTIIAPRLADDGLLISLDLTDNEGAEYYFGHTTRSRHTFTIGTSPAFYVEATFKVADAGGCDPVFLGFREIGAPNADYTTYTDAAAIGLHSTTVADFAVIGSNLNDAGWAYVDTTNAWADGDTHTVRVNVSAAGVVTYLIDGVAPTVTQALTFDATDVVIPYCHLLHGAATPGAIHLQQFACGLQ